MIKLFVVDSSGLTNFQAQSCHGALESILPEEMKSFFDDLNKRYMAIEFDPNLTKEEKTPHMVTWWSTAHEKMIEASLTRAQVELAVKSSEIILRENEAAFFDKLKNLPILLFSAGIADIVQAAMVYKANAGFTDNMKGKFSLRSPKNPNGILENVDKLSPTK